MEDEHCKTRCGLYRHRVAAKIPPGAERSWAVFVRLTAPAVERFRLEPRVFDLITDGQPSLDLIEDLNSIMEGVRAGQERLKT